MRIFKCQHCGQVLYFENVACERCAHRLGYLPQIHALSPVELQPDGTWTALAVPDRPFRFCANADSSACNWVIPADSDEIYCLACRHNRTIPDLTLDENVTRWRRFESAKHRLFYTLIRLKLPLANGADDPVGGLVFDMLAETNDPYAPRVMTGHENGVITFRLNEADDVHREQMRMAMGEKYRTLLGHFRHEIGHYFWDKLVRDGGQLEAFREAFGDESRDYAGALQTHYQNGPPQDWQWNYVSAYASAHPWEDFAESWAHYFHIVDTIEMASAFGLRLQPALDSGPDHSATFDFDPHESGSIERLIKAWLPLALSVNAINRCMGEADLYPFVLSPPVISKLGFVHELIHGTQNPVERHESENPTDESVQDGTTQ